MSLIEFPNQSNVPHNNQPNVPYKKMYTTLFNAITDALDIMQKDSLAASILMEAQQKTEEMYVSADPKARESKDKAQDPEEKAEKPEET